MAEQLGLSPKAVGYRALATKRQAAIDKFLWSAEKGFYRNYYLGGALREKGHPVF